MRLTTNQSAETDKYLNQLAKYRETFHELRDHVLSALRDSEASTFDMQLVKQIVEEDFGGPECITQYEAVVKRSSGKRYLHLLGAEMLNTFKWFGLVRNLSLLALSVIFYVGLKSSADISSLPLVKAMYVLFYLPGSIIVFLKFVVDRNKKPSILHNLLFKFWLLNALAGTLILQGIRFTNEYHHASNKLELGLLLCMYILMSIFTRAFLKLYKNRIRMLAV
jgi:hypothetical protein